ncbi:unnamed protein product [Pedinophyceae sp. YPF-701]|nr:unnamed protein product [Pedinophyceae sp. YPF-701]
MLRSFAGRVGLLARLRPAAEAAGRDTGACAAVSGWRLFSTSFVDKKEAADRIIEVVKNFDKVDPAKVEASSHFARDLGLDSLDTTEVVMAIEEEFGIEIPDAEADKIQTVSDAIEFISTTPGAK